MSRNKKLERDIESDCVLIAEAAGLLSFKLDKAKRSDPDRIFVAKTGQCCFVEFKRPGEKPRPQQKARLDELCRHGQFVLVIESTDQFRHWVLAKQDGRRPYWAHPNTRLKVAAEPAPPMPG